MIKALHDRGVYQQDIAQQVGVHPKTVSRALARNAAPSGTRQKRGSKLDGYKKTVDRLLAEAAAAGAVITKLAQDSPHFVGRSGYFADPDGHLWEVAWNPAFALGPDGALTLPP